MSQYPLRDNAADELHAYSGRPLNDITTQAIADGELSADDLRTHASALVKQAEIARQAGYPQLADSLLRGI